MLSIEKLCIFAVPFFGSVGLAIEELVKYFFWKLKKYLEERERMCTFAAPKETERRKKEETGENKDVQIDILRIGFTGC